MGQGQRHHCAPLSSTTLWHPLLYYKKVLPPGEACDSGGDPYCRSCHTKAHGPKGIGFGTMADTGIAAAPSSPASKEEAPGAESGAGGGGGGGGSGGKGQMTLGAVLAAKVAGDAGIDCTRLEDLLLPNDLGSCPSGSATERSGRRGSTDRLLVFTYHYVYI